MRKQILQLISQKEYEPDGGVILFEGECFFSFGMIELDDIF